MASLGDNPSGGWTVVNRADGPPVGLARQAGVLLGARQQARRAQRRRLQQRLAAGLALSRTRPRLRSLERACARWHLWAAGSDLRAWLLTLMHNLFVDASRRSARQHGQRVDRDGVAGELVARPAGADKALELQRCLLRLPEEQREVLLLVTLQDLAYAQVARITAVPLGTVMSRLPRARRRLHALMQGRARLWLCARGQAAAAAAAWAGGVGGPAAVNRERISPGGATDAHAPATGWRRTHPPSPA